MEIRNNVFVVTGGASGLGAATASMIIEKGGKVLIADINQHAGEEYAKSLGENARFHKTDVTSEESAHSAFTTACLMGSLRGLINCAGIAPGEKVVGKEGPHRLDSFTRCLNINLVGTFNMIRLAAEIMQKNTPNADGECGVLINTASIAAFEGQLGQAAYSASKAGIIGMMLPIARELARFGIRVMTIAPGIMETPMINGMAPEIQEALGKMVPFPPRLGKPTEYAALAHHIISNSYLNGDVIRLDGAIRMQAK